MSKKPTYAGLKVPKEGQSDAEYQKAVADEIKKALRTARPTDIDLSPEEIKKAWIDKLNKTRQDFIQKLDIPEEIRKLDERLKRKYDEELEAEKET